MSEEKAYKKFFLQRTVLDTVRVYINVSEQFVDHMGDTGLLSEDDVTILKGLPWPSNRNELLQILIKKPWNHKSFDSFCTILRDTQEESLTKMIVEKASEFITKELESSKDSYTRELDLDISPAKNGTGVNLQTQNAIRAMLRDRDEEIRRLKTEVEELHDNLKSIVEERNIFKELHDRMDREVNEWLVALHLSKVHDSMSDSLAEIKTDLAHQEVTIKELETEKIELTDIGKELRKKISLLTEENIELKWTNQSLVDTQEAAKAEYETKLNLLEKETDELKKEIARSNKMMNIMQSRSLDSSRTSDIELSNVKQKLNEVTKQLFTIITERDQAKQELQEVSDKTRKLLFKLDLASQAESLGLSLDHARNMSYSRRRRSSIQCLSNQLNESASNSSANTGTTSGNTSDRMSSVKELSPLSVAASSKRGKEMQPTEGPPETVDRQEGLLKCQICSKIYNEDSNFDGACVFHVEGASKINSGTELEVWSCCKSLDTIRGCQKGRHIPVVNSKSIPR